MAPAKTRGRDLKSHRRSIGVVRRAPPTRGAPKHGLTPPLAVVGGTAARHVRILVAEESPLLRLGIEALFADQEDLHVVGATQCLQETLAAARQLRPDLLLLDIALVPAMRRAAIEDLLTAVNGLRIVVLAMPAQRQHVIDVLQPGMRGLLFKSAAPELVLKCIRCVMAGQYWFDRDTVSDVMDGWRTLAANREHSAGERRFELTAREIEVIALIVDGFTNQDIATELSISGATVKHHLTRIYDKTGVSNRLALSCFARRHHLFVEADSLPSATAADDGFHAGGDVRQRRMSGPSR